MPTSPGAQLGKDAGKIAARRVVTSTHNRPVESLNVLDLLRVGQASEVEEQGAASACAPRMYATYEICASEALAPAARSSRAPRPRRQGAAPSAPARDVNGQENHSIISYSSF